MITYSLFQLARERHLILELDCLDWRENYRLHLSFGAGLLEEYII